MLDIEAFDKIPAGSTFATGVLPNSPTGIFMTRDGGDLRWVAVKGYAHDWAVYCHWAYHSEDFVASSGDKVLTPEYVKRCVPCTEEVMERYRI